MKLSRARSHLLVIDIQDKLLPAIDRGDPVVCPHKDQRGTPRPRDGDTNGSAVCDVGAVEVPEPGLEAMLVAGVLALAIGRRVRPVPYISL